ncbi:MAG: hypothetical protein NTW21_24100 [Verrucomicrobia bacterium]|nr:hypothetical protein [Verrucomicrobiota bacterium]
MDWIFEHLQIAVVLAIVAVALVRKIFENLNPNMPAGGPPRDEIFGPDADSAAPTPPPLRKVAGPPPLRQPTLAAPPQPTARGALDTELGRQHEIQERLRKIRETKAKKPPLAAVPTVLKRPAISAGLKSRLGSGKELRRAIVMREILAPPVSLSPKR